MSDSCSKIILVLFGWKFRFELFLSLSAQGIFVIIKFDLILVVGHVWAVPLSYSWTQSEVSVTFFVLVVVEEAMPWVRSQLFLHDDSIFKKYCTLVDAVRKEIVDRLLGKWGDFDMQMSEDIVFFCLVIGSIDWRDVGDIVTLLVLLLLLFRDISWKFWWLYWDIPVVISGVEIMWGQHLASIKNLDFTLSLNNPEGNANIFFRVDIGQIFIISIVLFNSVIQDNHFLQLSLAGTWSNVDRDLNIFWKSIDPDEDYAARAFLSCVFVVFVNEEVQSVFFGFIFVLSLVLLFLFFQGLVYFLLLFYFYLQLLFVLLKTISHIFLFTFNNL